MATPGRTTVATVNSFATAASLAAAAFEHLVASFAPFFGAMISSSNNDGGPQCCLRH